MNKYGKILVGIVTLLLIITIPILIYEKFENENNKMTDAEKFKKEYPGVTENNIFVYSNTTEIPRLQMVSNIRSNAK